MKRHLLGLVGAAVGAAVWACAEDPTGAIRNGVARVAPSATYTEVVVADSTTLSVRAEDEQGNPLPILPTVTSDDPSIATVSVIGATSGRPVPQTNFRVRGESYGTTTITMSAGGRSAMMTVQTLPRSIEITAPASLRSGETATISARAVDAAGGTVAGAPFELSVDDETVLAFDDVTLEIEAILAGIAVISATGPASSTGGVPVAEGVAPVSVLAGPPAGAALEATDFGAVGSGGTSTLEVVITDANGNQNNKVDEIISVTAMSSNMAVATVAAMLVDSIVEDIDTGEPLDTLRQVFVEVTGVAAGTVDITGSVETSEGTFDIGSSPATVLNPIITPATPSGGFASTITINGSGFLATGFETLVLVDGLALGNVTVVSDTEIEAQMPTFGTAGTFDLVVSVGGVTSDADTWTQTDAFDATATEPDNDDPGLAPVISVPFEFSGSFAGAPEEDDFFFLTVSDDVTVDIDLEWTPAKDLDILVTDGAFTAFVCTDGATGAAPEHSECDLDAGDYLLWLNDFDAFLNGDPTPVTYTVRGTRQ